MNRIISLAIVFVLLMNSYCYGAEFQDVEVFPDDTERIQNTIETIDCEMITDEDSIRAEDGTSEDEISEDEASKDETSEDEIKEDILDDSGVCDNKLSDNEALSENRYAVGKTSGSFGENATWTYNNGLVTIKGTGTLTPDSNTESQFGSIASSIKYLYIEPGITRISANAFINLTSLKYGFIPESVEIIDGKDYTDSLFLGCREGATIFINRGNISDYAYEWNYTSEKHKNYSLLGKSVTKELYFDYWMNFDTTDEIIEVKNKYIPYFAFEGVKGAKYIYLPQEVSYIKGTPFSLMEQKPVVMCQSLKADSTWNTSWSKDTEKLFFGVNLKNWLEINYAHNYHNVGDMLDTSALEVVRRADYIDKNDILVVNSISEPLLSSQYNISSRQVLAGANTYDVVYKADENIKGQFSVLGTDEQPQQILKGIKAVWDTNLHTGSAVSSADFKVCPLYDVLYIADKKVSTGNFEGSRLKASLYSVSPKVIDASTRYITITYTCDEGTFSQRVNIAEVAGTKSIETKRVEPVKEAEGLGFYGAADGFDIAIAKNKYNYTGSFIQPKIKLTYYEYEEVEHEKIIDEDYEYWTTYKTKKAVLKENVDFDVEYINNVNPGEATAIITGIGSYSGRVEIPFSIASKGDNSKIVMGDGSVNIDKAQVSLKSDKPIEYCAKAVVPKLQVSIDGTELKENKDYKLLAFNNVNAGKAVVYIIGQGSYNGLKRYEFTINKKSLENVKIKLPKNVEYPDSMEDVLPVIKDSAGLLKVDRDYVLEYGDLRKLVLADTGVPFPVKLKTIEGGNYEAGAEKELVFNIVKRNIGNKKRVSMYVEDGYYELYKGEDTSFTPNVNVFYNGIKLEKNKDYTLSYSNNDRVGTARINVTGIGIYSGKAVAKFKIHLEKDY